MTVPITIGIATQMMPIRVKQILTRIMELKETILLQISRS